MRLNKKNLNTLCPSIEKIRYSRSALKHGIVHIGVGGFHRAHQAVYTHLLLQTQPEENLQWGICGVGLRPADRAMNEVLTAQDHLYTVLELGDHGNDRAQVIGSITGFLYAPDDPEAVIEKLASEDTRIVSLTITESGYNIDDHSGEFNCHNPQVLSDLQQPTAPTGVFGYLAEALARRRQRQLPPFTLMSCDNLPHNGDVARRALLSYAGLRDPYLRDWIATRMSFPNSMVDRITPVTLAQHRARLQQHYGIDDDWPVICEPFKQWVLEDNFCNGRPAWDLVGVQLTDDVTPYEKVKIRLLNASHSAMAYLGYLAGLRYVHEVMADSEFNRLIRDFMDLDVTPALAQGVNDTANIDLKDYKNTLIQRFANSQVGDQLERLCMDGSSKIPKFLLPTLQQRLDYPVSLNRIALMLAAWALYLANAEKPASGYTIVDPLAETLQKAVHQRSSLAERFIGLEGIFGYRLGQSKTLIDAVENAVLSLEQHGVKHCISQLNDNQRLSQGTTIGN